MTDEKEIIKFVSEVNSKNKETHLHENGIISIDAYFIERIKIDEKNKIFAELGKLKTYFYLEVDARQGIVCWKDIEKIKTEDNIS